MWSMKKVLIVFNHPAPYKVRLFNELSKSFDLHVIFERDSASDRDAKFYYEDKYDFTVHKIKGIKIGTEGCISNGVTKHIKNNKYDLIIMNGYSHYPEMKAINYMKRHHIPYVLYINGGVIKKESFIKKAIKKHYIKGAKAYFSPDQQSNQYLIHYGANENLIFNYPYSTIFDYEILSECPNKASLREQLGIKFDKVFVSSGQLIERKNYVSLVKEWKKFPENYGFFLIGDGPQRKEIEKIIHERKIKNVVLTGFLPRAQMFQYFQASDAFLFPSKEDIYGHVINEALSQGIPVISTNNVNSAIKLVQNGQNGYLFDDLSGPLFESALANVLNMNAFSRCIKTAKENTIENMTKRHIEIINEVMEK